MSGPTNRPSVAINLESHIFLIRGHRVMLDADLAVLYGVKTSRLNEQVKRNINKFPSDFMFQLNQEEFKNLISQNATSRQWGGRRKFPFAFTEHGALQAANVLKSERAAEMSVFVVRAFIKLREVLTAHRQLAVKLLDLEKKVGAHDAALKAVIDAIRQLTAPPPAPKQKIGFTGTQKKHGAKP